MHGQTRTFRRARWALGPAPLGLVLAGCSTGIGGAGAGSPPSAKGSLQSANSTI